MKRTVLVSWVVALTLLAGCATPVKIDPELANIDGSKLPAPNVALSIPGLGPCTDSPDRTLHLNAQQPTTVLVHGCFGSSGRFRGLAQVLAFHGQQTACFTYDDRASLTLSAGQLTATLDKLAESMADKHVTVIGHSQGGLIARKSVAGNWPGAISSRELQLRLVTISGPFAGIASAKHCGSRVLRVLSLGIVPAICEIATGDKWSDITYSSDFILHPGALHRQVSSYLKIDTNESGSCRRTQAGVCVEKDNVFTLQEQRNALIDNDPLAKVLEVKAGHVEIVGDSRVAPTKLIEILQQNAVINATEPQRTAALQRLLTKVYSKAP